MLKEHDEGWYICEEHCGKKFKKQKNLDAHLERVNNNENRKNKQIYNFTNSDPNFQMGMSMNSRRSSLSIESVESDIPHDFLDLPPCKI